MNPIRRDKLLNRTYLFGGHIHHGLLGLAFAALGAYGVYLMWDDRVDVRYWFDFRDFHEKRERLIVLGRNN